MINFYFEDLGNLVFLLHVLFAFFDKIWTVFLQEPQQNIVPLNSIDFCGNAKGHGTFVFSAKFVWQNFCFTNNAKGNSGGLDKLDRDISDKAALK